MKVSTKFSPITQKDIEEITTQLKGILSDDDINDIKTYIKPYETFSNEQLDDIFLLVKVTIQGNGKVINLKPTCSVDQEDWHVYEDEPDIRIDPISIPFKTVFPQMPIEVSGTTSFFAVVEAEGNIWDSCKDLPSWIWDEQKFDFALWFTATTEDGKTYEGNSFGDYAQQLIVF
ncbi:hypothetical protein [uncultured Kordia sp.]|uniref:hypothetical protein n=1 Tax=uncultured Kordia sp. TaxID=507699 RepID=UPI002625792A|nr:hypothetical protein [uncultured Kordia sp.]